VDLEQGCVPPALKRTVHDVVDEWAGVCSEVVAKNPTLMVTLLANFIQSEGLTDALDDFLRIQANYLSDPAAE
jgi:hypothetical protein